MDTEVTNMTPIWEIDTAITTATARVTVVERAMEETEYRTEATAGMGVHRGVKGNHPTLTTTNTESGSIAATRLTVAELDHADYRGRGGLYLGNIGNSLVNKYDIHQRKKSERLGDQSHCALITMLGNETGYIFS